MAWRLYCGELLAGHTIPVMLMVLTTLLSQVTGTGVFEVDLESFRNDQGVAEGGSCCAGIFNKGQCTASCRTFFTICLKEYQANIDPSTVCTFGSIRTPVIGFNSFNVEDRTGDFVNPVQFPFEFTWPGDFTLIISAWHDYTADGPSPDSHRELISRMATQRSVRVGSVWTQDVYSSDDDTELRYSYRVVCDEHYFGEKCSEFCKSRDDNFGHYTCGEDGTPQCLDGWTGRYCENPICLPGCHPTNGQCLRPNECECHTGWRGELCQECVRYPGCLNGDCGTPWECNCFEGWGGVYCNLDLNYCTHHEPCKNGATCTNTGKGSYTCTCPPDFTGTNCERRIDDCNHRPCLNGGNCTDMGESYMCRCPAGFHGRHCESSATSCEESPCNHSGVCIPTDDGYRCSCQPGYTGINCEVEVDECASTPCANGGGCVDALDGYRCVCKPGFTGANCEDDHNDCFNNPCQHGGSCWDLINSFECHCAPGYEGRLCESNIDDCLSQPCANGGTCLDGVDGFQCSCLPGYTSEDCHQIVQNCENNPCLNSATCTDVDGSYTCSCQPGFFGGNCEFHEGDVPVVSTTPGTRNISQPGVHGTVTSDTIQGPPTNDTNITLQQLLLIVCLGVGIPIIVIAAIIVFILCNRRRRNRQNSSNNSSVHKDNEQNEITNMNNKLRKFDNTNIINSFTSPSSQTFKVTNEDQEVPPHKSNMYSAITRPIAPTADSSSTSGVATNRDHLNVDKHLCTINKNYIKDNIYKSTRTSSDLLEVHRDMQSVPPSSGSKKVDYSVEDQDKGRPGLHHTMLPDAISSSKQHTSGDLSHPVKPWNSDAPPPPSPNPGPIFYLDAGQPYPGEGMLATEV